MAILALLGVYRAIDGVTFNALTTDGSTPFAAATYQPGTCGIVFDPSQGTTTVGGQTRTKRIIIPVAGSGIWESTDGGQNFTEVATATIGRSDISVYKAAIDYNGVYYAVVSYAGSQSTGYLWRYAGGAWVLLTAQSGWTSGTGQSSSYVAAAQGTCLIVDPRSGHNGFVSVSINGIESGYTSTNADSATLASIAWGGSSSTANPYLTAPSYDVPWLSHVAKSGGVTQYIYGTHCIIDNNGNCWWSGNQGAIWRFTASDLSTPAIPNYAVSMTTYSVTTSRGTEVTVAQDIIRPPGATHPIMGAQDVGIFQADLSGLTYPTDFYPSPSRVDCESVEYSAADPTFVVAKVDAELSLPASGAKSAYSISSGLQGTWTPYAHMPDFMYEGVVTGYIDNGSGSSGTILHVTAITSGNVMIGQAVENPSTLGTIMNQISGTPFGIGTYTIDTAQLTTSATLTLTFATESGNIVAVDKDHHVCVPSGYNGVFNPVYTANATGACSWSFCSGLPPAHWMNRSFVFGPPSKPFAVGYGTDLGTVWAFQAVANSQGTGNISDGSGGSGTILTFTLSVGFPSSLIPGASVYNGVTLLGKITKFVTNIGGTGTYIIDTSQLVTGSPTLTIKGNSYLYRSADSGATFSSVYGPLDMTYSFVGQYVLSVPGYPDELWLAGSYTGGGGYIWHVTNARTGSPPTVTQKNLPVGYTTPIQLTLGAPASPGGYPTIYGLFFNGNGGGTPTTIFQGTYVPGTATLTWSLFAHSTGTAKDLPASCEIAGIQSIKGDPSTYGLLYCVSGASGFAYGYFP